MSYIQVKSSLYRVRIIATTSWLKDYAGQECDAIFYEEGISPMIDTEQLRPPLPRWQSCSAYDLHILMDFKCHVCGRECDTAPMPPARAVCEEHCEDHFYKYVRGEREWRCTYCDKLRPYDW